MDVGSGGQPGVAWMQSTDLNWYAIQLSGSKGNASIFINQTPLNYGSSSNAGNYVDSQSFGYQLLQGNDQNVYQVYLTGNAGSVQINVSQSAWFNQYDYKPYFFMLSFTDECYYVVSVVVSGSTKSLVVNQSTAISGNLMPW